MQPYWTRLPTFSRIRVDDWRAGTPSAGGRMGYARFSALHLLLFVHTRHESPLKQPVVQ